MSDLDQFARAILKRYGTIDAAVPLVTRMLLKRHDWLRELVRDYLTRFLLEAADPEKIEAGVGGTKAAADQNLTEAQTERIGGGDPAKPITVHQHQRARHHVLSNEDKAKERRAMVKTVVGALEYMIYGKAIGDYTHRELLVLRRERLEEAVNKLNEGVDAFRDVALIDRILCHAEVDDSVKVRDYLKEEDFAAMMLDNNDDLAAKIAKTKVAARRGFTDELEYRAN